MCRSIGAKVNQLAFSILIRCGSSPDIWSLQGYHKVCALWDLFPFLNLIFILHHFCGNLARAFNSTLSNGNSENSKCF